MLTRKIEPVCAITFGPSGSGKGYCVGDILSEFHGVDTFTTGDWCREHLADLARCGELAPDDLVNEAVRSHFHQHNDPYYNIDAPRTVEQATFFLDMYRSRYWFPKIVVFHIDATHDQSFALIRHRAERQGREDDAKPDAIEKRLLTYFKKGGILETVAPFLRSSVDHFVTIKHEQFSDPLNATDNHIDSVMDTTRKYMRVHIAPEYFVRPHDSPKGVLA